MERRWKLIQIPSDGPQGFLDALRGKAHAVNLPDDAEIMRISYDPATDMLLIAIQSATFPPAPQGCQLVRFDVLMQRVIFHAIEAKTPEEVEDGGRA